MTNSNLAEELQKSKYQASHLEQTSKKLREEKLSAEKERDHVVEQNKSLSITIEVFHRLPLLLPYPQLSYHFPAKETSTLPEFVYATFHYI